MQALSSLMRGDMGPLSNPYTAANAASTGRQSGGTFRSLTHPGAGAASHTAPVQCTVILQGTSRIACTEREGNAVLWVLPLVTEVLTRAA